MMGVENFRNRFKGEAKGPAKGEAADAAPLTGDQAGQLIDLHEQLAEAKEREAENMEVMSGLASQNEWAKKQLKVLERYQAMEEQAKQHGYLSLETLLECAKDFAAHKVGSNYEVTPTSSKTGKAIGGRSNKKPKGARMEYVGAIRATGKQPKWEGNPGIEWEVAVNRDDLTEDQWHQLHGNTINALPDELTTKLHHSTMSANSRLGILVRFVDWPWKLMALDDGGADAGCKAETLRVSGSVDYITTKGDYLVVSLGHPKWRVVTLKGAAK